MYPTARGMCAEGTPFRGVLFAGLMIENGRVRWLLCRRPCGAAGALLWCHEPAGRGDIAGLLTGEAAQGRGVALLMQPGVHGRAAAAGMA